MTPKGRHAIYATYDSLRSGNALETDAGIESETVVFFVSFFTSFWSFSNLRESPTPPSTHMNRFRNPMIVHAFTTASCSLDVKLAASISMSAVVTVDGTLPTFSEN